MRLYLKDTDAFDDMLKAMGGGPKEPKAPSAPTSASATPAAPAVNQPAPAAPGITAPSAHKTPGAVSGTSGGSSELETCPLGAACPDGGKHKPGSSHMIAHTQQFENQMATGLFPGDESTGEDNSKPGVTGQSQNMGSVGSDMAVKPGQAPSPPPARGAAADPNKTEILPPGQGGRGGEPPPIGAPRANPRVKDKDLPAGNLGNLPKPQQKGGAKPPPLNAAGVPPSRTMNSHMANKPGPNGERFDLERNSPEWMNELKPKEGETPEAHKQRLAQQHGFAFPSGRARNSGIEEDKIRKLRVNFENAREAHLQKVGGKHRLGHNVQPSEMAEESPAAAPEVAPEPQKAGAADQTRKVGGKKEAAPAEEKKEDEGEKTTIYSRKESTQGEKPKGKNPKLQENRNAGAVQASRDYDKAQQDHAKAKSDAEEATKRNEEGQKKFESDTAEYQKQKAAGNKKAKPPKKFKAEKVTAAPEKPALNKPSSDAEKLQHSAHREKANEVLSRVESHLENNPDLTPEQKEKLETVHRIASYHAAAEHMPTSEHKSALNEADKASKNAGAADHWDTVQSKKIADQEKATAQQAKEEMKADKAEAQSKKKLEKEFKVKNKEAEEKAAEEPKLPETDLEHAQVAHHVDKSKNLRANIQSHLENNPNLSPEEQQQAQHVLSALDSHENLQHVPTAKHKSELQELHKLAGSMNKQHVPEEEQYESPHNAADKRAAANALNQVHSGVGLGETQAQAAINPWGAAGRMVTAGAHAGFAGAIQTGHSLLHQGDTAERNAAQSAFQAKQDEANAKRIQQQASRKEASMRLYLDLDLHKAVGQIPSTSQEAQSGRQASRSYNESFDKDPVGAAGGSPDDGGHSHGDSLDDELEEDRKRDSQIAQERGIVTKDVKKSEAEEILKSFSSKLQTVASVHRLNPTEVEYLLEIGYSTEEIRKGQATISGYERSKFNDWLQERLAKSVRNLVR